MRCFAKGYELFSTGWIPSTDRYRTGMLRPWPFGSCVLKSLFLTHISSHQRGQEWREDLSLVSGLGIPNAQYHRQAFVAQGNEKTWTFAVYWSYHSFYFGIGL